MKRDDLSLWNGEAMPAVTDTPAALVEEREAAPAVAPRKARKPRARKSEPAIGGDAMRAEVAAMHKRWKRIHEISGEIVAKLEEFSDIAGK